MEHSIPGEAQSMTPERLRQIALWVIDQDPNSNWPVTGEQEKIALELRDYAKDLERWLFLEKQRGRGRLSLPP